MRMIEMKSQRSRMPRPISSGFNSLMNQLFYQPIHRAGYYGAHEAAGRCRTAAAHRHHQLSVLIIAQLIVAGGRFGIAG
jgi:hypothetical protein